jgi:periplasmic protein TonB
MYHIFFMIVNDKMAAMRRNFTKTLQRHTIWLSLLGHLLLLLSFLIVLVVTASKEKPPSTAPQSVPSYLSPSPEAPPSVQQERAAQSQPQPQQKTEMKETAKDGIEKPAAKKKEQAKAASKPNTARDPRQISFARDAVPEDITSPTDQEPMHLIGESKIIKPLIKILARALSKHLFYPRVAADFNLRGVVLVGFVLHPEGYVTDTRVVKSSGAGVLDDAARDAVGAMSPVGDVSEYVPKPEFLVVGIIFG